MALDFPSSPTTGQLFPTSPAPGTPQFRFDGTAWSNANISMTGAVRYDTSQSLTAPQQAQARANENSVSKSGDTMTGNLGITGTLNVSSTIQGSGNIIANAAVYTGYVNAASGSYLFGSNGTKYLTCDGTNYAFATGQLTVNGALGITGTLSTNGYDVNTTSGNFYGYAWMLTSARAWGFTINSGTGDTTLWHNTASWTTWRASDGAFIHLIGNCFKPGGGTFGDSSDSRIKNVLGTYDSGLDAINALRPIRYTFKGNDTDDPPLGEPIEKHDLKASLTATEPPSGEREEPTVPYHNSRHRHAAENSVEFIGLVAQECETAMPELVSQRRGYIDGEEVQDLRDIDTGPLIFALINAVKELSAKVAALEAK